MNKSLKKSNDNENASFNEDESVFSSKVSRLIENNIAVIYCFGETLNDYKNKKTKLIIKRQLKKLLLNNENNLKKHPSKLILAYETLGLNAIFAELQSSQAITHKTWADLMTHFCGGYVSCKWYR